MPPSLRTARGHRARKYNQDSRWRSRRFQTLQGSDVCCGGAGIYNLLQPELSQKILDEKLKNISDTNAQILATGNPGCHMHIGAGAPPRRHEEHAYLSSD
ncbi:MAG: heterodisulfide reductase-related iron-sulfur binding cluster [Pyrinomonadaceae bacterium]